MKKLASESVGKVLRTVLLTLIAVEVIAMAITSLYVINFDLYLTVANIEQLINVFILITTIIMFVIYLIWMYKVHVDMNYYNLNYPIKPSKSVWSFLIPIYNLYGAWNVHSKLANNFSQRNYSNAYKISDNILRLIPLAYLFTFINRALNNYVNSLVSTQQVISDFVWMSVDVIYLALLLTYWGLFKTITSGVHLISATNVSSDEDETTQTEGA